MSEAEEIADVGWRVRLTGSDWEAAGYPAGLTGVVAASGFLNVYAHNYDEAMDLAAPIKLEGLDRDEYVYSFFNKLEDWGVDRAEDDE